jgi:hypothetical protein
MIWALVLVVVIGIGLPVGAWAVTLRLPPPRPVSRLGVGYDRTDKWLLTRYQLPPHDRWRVREAVLGGRRVNDAGLEHAAHGLAADLLARTPWTVRVLDVERWAMPLLAAGLACWGIVLLTTRRPSEGLAQGVNSLIYSGLSVLVAILARRGSRQFRQNVTKARELNQADSSLDA